MCDTILGPSHVCSEGCVPSFTQSSAEAAKVRLFQKVLCQEEGLRFSTVLCPDIFALFCLLSAGSLS